MKPSDDAIYRLKNSVDRLVKKNQNIEKQNEQFALSNARQLQEISILKKKLETTQAKLDTITMSNSLIQVSGGTRLAKQRINNLLRDIDKCISLVNR